MSQGRSVWRMLFQNMINSVRIRPLKGTFVGEDHLGNKYFKAVKGHVTNKKHPIRWFEPKEENDWKQDLPAEWEAWLRNRRSDPPTVEEVMRNAAIAQMKKEGGEEVKRKMDEERGYSLPEDHSMTKGFRHLEGMEREPGTSLDEEKKS